MFHDTHVLLFNAKGVVDELEGLTGKGICNVVAKVAEIERMIKGSESMDRMAVRFEA